VLASVAIGCTPSPEKTCDRLQELSDKEKSKFSLSRDKCLKRMNEMKERDPDAYKCAAKAIAKLDTLDLAFTATSVCDYKKKSKGDDDDKGGKAGKKSKGGGEEDGFGACVGDAGDKVKKGMPKTFCLEHQSEHDCTKPGAKIDWTWKEGKTCADEGFEKKCTGEWPKSARFETCPEGNEER
jgi:hypothetical protein